MPKNAVYAGVDVSKARLDFAFHREDEIGSVPNDESGNEELVERFSSLSPALIVLEATGGFEMPLAAASAAAGLTIVVANPRQVRNFAKSTGQLAKTDELDAQILALFAARVRPSVRPLPDEATQAFAALVTRRRQLIEMLVAEKNRLGFAQPAIQKGIKKHVRWLERQLSDVEADLDSMIR